jgi:hypothetical protein
MPKQTRDADDMRAALREILSLADQGDQSPAEQQGHYLRAMRWVVLTTLAPSDYQSDLVHYASAYDARGVPSRTACGVTNRETSHTIADITCYQCRTVLA